MKKTKWKYISNNFSSQDLDQTNIHDKKLRLDHNILIHDTFISEQHILFHCWVYGELNLYICEVIKNKPKH